MGSKKKRKREVEGGSPDIPVLRAMREELSLPYLPQLFYPDDADDTDPMRGNEKRTGASTSSEPDSWTSVEFREIDGVKRVVGLSLDNRTLREVPMTNLKRLDALETLDLTANELSGLPNEFGGYDLDAEAMAETVAEFARAGFLNIVGGCCGTTPEHIAAIARAVVDIAPRKIPSRPRD